MPPRWRQREADLLQPLQLCDTRSALVALGFASQVESMSEDSIPGIMNRRFFVDFGGSGPTELVRPSLENCVHSRGAELVLQTFRISGGQGRDPGNFICAAAACPADGLDSSSRRCAVQKRSSVASSSIHTELTGHGWRRTGQGTQEQSCAVTRRSGRPEVA